MADRIQLRRDTAANWTAANPVLADGEPGFERDTGKRKTGDGTTPWNSLRYDADGTEPIAPRVTTVAYAAAITPNCDTTGVLNVGALTGNLTMQAPAGTPRDGQTLTMRISTDATAGRTITWNSAYAFGTDITTALIPTTANAKWQLIFQWSAADAKWRACGLVRGF